METAHNPEPPIPPRTVRVALRARAAARRARSAATRGLRWLALHAIVAAISVGAGLLVVALATEYGYHPLRNAASWVAQPMRYAAASTCGSCHSVVVASAAAAPHGQVSCQACHGPMAAHVRTASPPDATAAVVPVSVGGASTAAPNATTAGPGSCLVCHERVLGRPTTVAVISTAAHYGGGVECTLCHDPHVTTAAAPPIVRHELDGLPGCLVCHGQGGLRAMTAAHPSVGTIDCLLCHLRRASVAP